jgi:hypothetical protein
MYIIWDRDINVNSTVFDSYTDVLYAFADDIPAREAKVFANCAAA